MSGTEFGYTLGTPIGLFVPNEDQRPGDYKEMSAIPRPGHADFTYQVKYGTRASSGGGRSSARETIARVAAGAIAEKWLKEMYNTEISCWVSSIGNVVMPEAAVPLSDGTSSGWTREEVDTIGCLRMLRSPKHYRVVSEAEVADAAERKKEQMKVEDASEAAFLADLNAGAKTLKKEPCYSDYKGVCYNMDGEPVATPADLAKWETDELLPLRACRARAMPCHTASSRATPRHVDLACTSSPIGCVSVCVCVRLRILARLLCRVSSSQAARTLRRRARWRR